MPTRHTRHDTDAGQYLVAHHDDDTATLYHEGGDTLIPRWPSPSEGGTWSELDTVPAAEIDATIAMYVREADQ